MLQFDIDVKTGIRLREVTLNDAPMIYRAIADHRDYLKTWLPFVINLSEQDEMDFLSQVLSFPEEERNFTFAGMRGNGSHSELFGNDGDAGRVCEFRFCQSSYRNRLLAVARISATRNNDPKCSDTLSMGCGSTFDASHSNSVCRRKLFE